MKRLLIAEILTGDFLFTWTSQAETVAINYSCANSKSLSFCITLNVEHISGIKLSRIGGIAAAASHGPTPKPRTGAFRWRVNLYLGNYSPLGNHSRRREQRRCAFFPPFLRTPFVAWLSAMSAAGRTWHISLGQCRRPSSASRRRMGRHFPPTETLDRVSSQFLWRYRTTNTVFLFFNLFCVFVECRPISKCIQFCATLCIRKEEESDSIRLRYTKRRKVIYIERGRV